MTTEHRPTEAKTAQPQALSVAPCSGFQTYQPEIWHVKKDDIYAAIHAVGNGLDYARECLIAHDTNLGRTTLKNRTWAERMEEDIRQMESTLNALRLCPNKSI